MVGLESFKERIESVIKECEEIIKNLDLELDSTGKASFQQIKEIELTITRFKKQGLTVPDELKQLKLKLLADSDNVEKIKSLKKCFIENIQRILPNDISGRRKKIKLIQNPKIKKQSSREFPPEGTLCRFIYKGNEYNGQIKNGQFIVNNYGTFSTFSSASGKISNTSRNGWRDWELKVPMANQWLLADIWRNNKKEVEKKTELKK